MIRLFTVVQNPQRTTLLYIYILKLKRAFDESDGVSSNEDPLFIWKSEMEFCSSTRERLRNTKFLLSENL